MSGHSQGRLFIVGIGPGSPEEMTPRAREALEKAEVVVGYKRYLELLGPLVKGKATFSTGMRQEKERAERAIKEAMSGKVVAAVSSGDAGIYGIAGLVLELLSLQGSSANLEVEVIPGISAFLAASARLGAPLMNDFALISLSDLLTPWQVIEKRLSMAAQADFVIVLYNPKSHKRSEQIKRAVEVIAASRPPFTPVGIAYNLSRQGERLIITSLGQTLEHPIDMNTILIVGNSTTFRFRDFLITPRGYRL